MPLPDEFRPSRLNGHEPGGGELQPAEPKQTPKAPDPSGAEAGATASKRACAREETPTGPPPRLTVADRLVLTISAFSRVVREQLRESARTLRHGEMVTERSPSVRDRYARVARLGRATPEMIPLVKAPWLGLEYVAATLATLVQTAASCVGTLLGLATTTGVGLAVCQLLFGVPF